eukprot:PhF_6_TR33015/c0_g1_i1/m.48654
MMNVNRLLDTCFRVPYNHKNQTWFRWFSPDTLLSKNNSNHTVALMRLSELAVFDYVLGNTDRSPNKNNFVAGGCINDHCLRPGLVPRLGPPSFLTLDNGMTFYGHTSVNPLHGRNTTFCFFRRPLIQRLTDLNNTFVHRLKALLPKGAVRIIGSVALRECQRRLAKVLGQVERCREQWGDENV